MYIKAERNSIKGLIFVCSCAAVAGLCNGFLGAGGGIILMYMFTKINKNDSASAKRDNFACVVASVLPLSVVSAINYSARGSFSFSQIAVYILPAIGGGIIGALLTDKLSTEILKLIFAVIMIVAGVNMAF